MKNLIFYSLLVFIAINTAKANTIYPDTNLTVLVDEYKRVNSSELTPPIIEQILKEYPTSKLGAVYKNDKGQFKLIMVIAIRYF